jgi:oxygen-independent coproporphyrinogen-3 oxidase
MTSQAFQRYAEQSVPRYTSYPTAPHFSDAVNADIYQSWLTRLDPELPVSLYLHVPFCRQICWYCGCNMKLASKRAPLKEYTETLKREVVTLADTLPDRMQVSHLHWGGGTPTVLDPDDFEATMTAIRERFDIAEDAELAVECDPRTLAKSMIERIGALGFTRASFGVQEFDPKVQAAINRIQPPDMVKAAVDDLRAAGISGINFDLIYGLPYQTTETLLDTIDICAEMRPNRIALFGYAHVPWMAKKQRMIDEASLPRSADRVDQASAAAEALQRAGYVAIGLDHFALPEDDMAIALAEGTLRRNFQGYTTDNAQALLGIGATSISRTPEGFTQNISETGAWARNVEEGRLPIARGRALIGQDALRGHVIEALMCLGKVDLHAAAKKFGAPERWYASSAGVLTDLMREGLIDFVAGRLSLTEAGKPLVRVVASAFDEYLSANKARHAVAV